MRNRGALPDLEAGPPGLRTRGGAAGRLGCSHRGSLRPHPSAPHVFLQLPAFLWDKGTLATAIAGPAYLVKVLSFSTLLMTLVVLLILVWKVTKDKGPAVRARNLRKEGTSLA
ncbi:small integral membrane protein 42 [Canis lupus baileyi]|uniref:small integral membrane protein 42 n=1 Tax=Canis lupus baileyi TaxID=143281 RepID=UPI003B97C823